jgi:hypothetical protein
VLSHEESTSMQLTLICCTNDELAGGFHLPIAVAAIDGLIAPGFKRNLGIFTALRTFGGEHLAGGTRRRHGTAAETFRLSFLTARRATLRFVGIALGLIEFLLVCREGESSSAVCALKLFVLKRH